ncbi:hypothetical protein [Rhizorhabdus sp.]|jgi:hypothetical protein|uniref:hypothetical protein n=1 Tax=Rhizorhabdus sp. TaxID=1968843 RepID=UPI001214215B|nr:hypothetical protein [Rhizorhabdus sp.]MBD3762102.1 hypothetical protein [Rhizorhabdus sp.]TAK06840.1 MAG: hypothetical protein EPO38_13660 [Rhizorhabdus sp.]
MDLSVSLIVAIASALVGLLCFYLTLVALARLKKVRKGKGALGDTEADLKIFARNQALSAIVMVALAAFILLYS